MKSSVVITDRILSSAPILLVATVSICAGSAGAAETNTGSHASIKATANAIKIASFAPSNTELLYSIDGGDKLIGVCTYCDSPNDVSHKEKVGTFTSANLERLSRLKPDLILLVSGQEALSSALQRSGFKTVVLQNHHIDDVSKNLLELGALTNSQERATKKATAFSQSITELKNLLKKSETPKVFFCAWPQPLITVGHGSFLNDAITICGGINIASDLTQDYPHYSLERLVAKDPDVIILPFESRSQAFLHDAPWSKLRAVKQNRLFFLPAPAEDGLSRPSLRLNDGLFWLSQRLHPELAKQLEAWHQSSKKNIR